MRSSSNTAPVIDPRDAAAIFDELLARLPAWTPELKPVAGDPIWALQQIFARDLQSVIDRLNQAPDKHLLAFLDMLGIDLVPPQPARVPIVFTPAPNATDATVPAGTRVSAKVASKPAPLVFETEETGALAAARLTDVITLWPARDQYAEHTSDAAGGRPFVLFEPGKPVPHEIYLSHETVFAFSGRAAVDVEFELATPSDRRIATNWEFWDGQVWRPFREFNRTDPRASRDATNGFTRSGALSLRAECGESKPVAVRGATAHWIRGRVADAFPPDPARVLPLVDRIRVRSVADDVSIADVDAAFADAQQLDLTKPFFPFDQQPKAGSAFYLSAARAFEKPGAVVTISAEHVSGPAGASGADVGLEYWNGRAWSSLLFLPDHNVAGTFIMTGSALQFTVPRDIASREVAGKKANWIRLIVRGGDYVGQMTTNVGGTDVTFPITIPPSLKNLTVSYVYRSPYLFPDHCFTFNDFQWAIHSRDVRWPGNLFPVFNPVADTSPVFYLGFDRPLPNDRVSLYLDIDEADAEGPTLVWESWTGTNGWQRIDVEDETGKLSRPGMISFIPPPVSTRPEITIASAAAAQVVARSPLDAARFKPGDQIVVRQDPNLELGTIDSIAAETITLQVPLAKTYTGGTATLAALPRFGTSRDWIRARLKDDGAPARNEVNGIFFNAFWVSQVETITGEVLGAGLGVPNQSLFFNRNPVLPDEQIEVRELDGQQAEIQFPILQEELRQLGFTNDDVRTESDPRTGKLTEVWVLWRSRPHFHFSTPADRHYIVDRTRGRLQFGDGEHGALPPVKPGNIRARQYRAGGGPVGNVPAGAISQIMSGVLASGVTNPRAGEGGADAETSAQIRARGPNVLRHQERSLSALDYESLAREASPAVAAVRVLPATAPNGRPAPGWVTIVIVPQSQDAQPMPSFELRQQVHDFLAARAPATLSATRIGVVGPTYLPIGVSAIIVPRHAGDAGLVEHAAADALAHFLHPLTGGPDGEGWPFGRSVFASDVAAILEDLTGVDHIEQLQLQTDNVAVGDVVKVPPDRMVVAGPLRLTVRGR